MTRPAAALCLMLFAMQFVQTKFIRLATHALRTQDDEPLAARVCCVTFECGRPVPATGFTRQSFTGSQRSAAAAAIAMASFSFSLSLLLAFFVLLRRTEDAGEPVERSLLCPLSFLPLPLLFFSLFLLFALRLKRLSFISMPVRTL